MHDDDLPPELAFAEDGEVGIGRSRRMRRVARVVVVIAIACLVLPGILIGIATATRTAELACSITAAELAPYAEGFEARFELSGHEGPGWYCYSSDVRGTLTQLRFLGFIPEVRVVPGGSPGVSV